MNSLNPDTVTILQVGFGDRWIEISWHDALDSTARSVQYHQDQIDPTLVPEQLSDVMDSLKEMLETAAIERRDPPKSFTK